MPHLALADATSLDAWARRIEAQSTFPLLLRRLVHGTLKDLTHVGFPAGDAVQLGGWDGVVVAESGNAFVPDGESVWELGTNRDVKGKADADYDKRTANPRGLEPAQTTFVFATPRRWTGKETWVNARRAEGIWHDVRAYDADDLEEWLEIAPSVHIWLSNLLGLFPEDATALDTSWLDWSERTVPSMTTRVILSGRKEAQAKLYSWLADPAPPTIAVQAESRDEALAVLMAVIMGLQPEERIVYLSRAVVVRSLRAWAQLSTNRESLILIPMFDSPEAIARALRAGHRVIIPLGRSDSASSSAILVPRLAADEVMRELQEEGLPEERARDLSTLARRSFASFMRKLAIAPEVQMPEWARPSEGPHLLSALLAGAWNADVEGDRETLASLAQISYADLNQLLVRWANESDPPIRSVANTWYLTSKEDAWALLAKYLTGNNLTILEEVVLKELGRANPRFDIPIDERWRSSQPPRISNHLREGLAETLVILGTRNDAIGSVHGQEFVRRCVWKLLEAANEDWRLWASLPLQMLAEAAPDVFLNAVDKGLRGQNPVVMRLFETEGDPLFSSSSHTDLLWALELVAWSPEHLSQAAHLLATLARFDPGGKISNRPAESLYQIFLFWHTQTSASFEQRIQVLDSLKNREPEVAWRLYQDLLPSVHRTASNNPVPRWRDWAPDIQPTTYSQVEYYDGACEIVQRMLELAGTDGERWKVLIENLSNLPADQRERLVERLREIDVGSFDEAGLTIIWKALRGVISNHRSYSDAGWAMPATFIDQLDELHHRFEPADQVLRHAWLFDHRPALLEGRETDWREHERLVASHRQQSIKAVFENASVEGLFGLALASESPWDVGVTLGLSDLLSEKDENLILTQHLASEMQQLAIFARGFASGRVRHVGQTWCSAVVERLWTELSPNQQAQFLICLPPDARTFDLAESSDETEREFWRLANPRYVDPPDAERAIKKLLNHGRPFIAVDLLDFLASQESPPSPGFIAEALATVVRTVPNDDRPGNTFSYHLAQLLSKIEESGEINEDTIANLEWALLPAMGRYGHDRPPKVLHRHLGREPGFFVQLIGWMYKAEGSEPRGPTPELIARAKNGHDLLDSWCTMPGTGEAKGDIDATYLMDWVRRAREGLAESGRLAVGDITLGNLFAHSPVGLDGTWPHPAVREVIETVASREIEKGLYTGIVNSRGVFSRGLDEGGEQERSLAAKYEAYAEAIRGSAFRTAAVLRDVATRYKTEASQEDQETELRGELGW